MQIITRLCCNRELNASCIHGCEGLYCANEDDTSYFVLDGDCGSYINKEVFSTLLREEVWRRDAEESSNTY